MVRDFDLMDDGDPTIPPMLSCEKCGGDMYQPKRMKLQNFKCLDAKFYYKNTMMYIV